MAKKKKEFLYLFFKINIKIFYIFYDILLFNTHIFSQIFPANQYPYLYLSLPQGSESHRRSPNVFLKLFYNKNLFLLTRALLSFNFLPLFHRKIKAYSDLFLFFVYFFLFQAAFKLKKNSLNSLQRH